MAAGNDEMSKSAARERAEALREEIDYHDHRYYVEDDPVVSDAEYDELKSELESIEERWPDLVTPDSPTRRVGGEPQEALGTMRHESPMQSLKAVSDEAEFRRFWDHCRDELGVRRLSVVAEPKFDGLSVEITWSNGRYESAATRGDGRTGEDVTANVRTIRAVPMRLRGGEDHSVPRRLVARGEVYMDKDDFVSLNEAREGRGERTFANPRNAAAGSLRQLDTQITADRPLKIYFWEIAPPSSRRPRSQWESLELMKALGLRVNPHRERLESADGAVSWHRDMQERREELAYEIDGCVFKVNDLDAQRALGSRANSPRWALAWKFPPRRRTTRIRHIEAYVGRTGRLTPVAVLEPVHIGGVEVTHVSLHNQDEIERKDVRVGDTVLVERAGDVIPHVVRVVEEERSGNEKKYRLPDECPSCGSEISRPGDEADARCTNVACPAQRKKRLEHFAARDALDIDGLGERLVDELVERELVTDPADLFELGVDELQTLGPLAEKSARKLADSIEAAREAVTLPRLVFALGIPHVGKALAGDLARAFGSLQALLDAEADELDRMEGVGQTVAEAIRDWTHNAENRELVRRLARHGIDPRVERAQRRLEGTALVITGSLDSMTRDEAEEAVRAQGGRVTSSVSGNTDYLVVGHDPGTRKREQARSHGIEAIDETEFRRLLGGS